MANEKTQQARSTPAPTATPEPTDAPVQTLAAAGVFVVTDETGITNKPVVVQAPVVLDKQQANSVTLESVIESIKLSDNQPGRFVISVLENYIGGMMPGLLISRSQCASYQVGLWQGLYNFIENTEEDFDKIYSVVLGLFYKHKDGVFHEHYVFRMMSDVTLDKEEVFAFQVLINLIKVTADPVGRQVALKQNIDISRTLSNVFSENARQKILAFYGM